MHFFATGHFHIGHSVGINVNYSNREDFAQSGFQECHCAESQYHSRESQ